MNLAEYERAKFELAAILRAAHAIQHRENPEVENPFTDLFARLAEDRFNLVVVGRFNRGKTSLMNALLRTGRLPTGIVPLTSVITTVGYGSVERAYIERENWSMAQEISIDKLPEFITQERNPGNELGVAVARVELPAELLRRGFYFVDTPGLGSSIVENTRTTQRFLPQADAFVLVTSYDSPLSVEELRVLGGTARSPVQIFLVVNKQDAVGQADRALVLEHVRDQAARELGANAGRIFSISAKDAVEANIEGDAAKLAASGIPELSDAISRYLLGRKQQDFLIGMCDRIDSSLAAVPDADELRRRIEAVRRRLATTGDAADALAPDAETEEADRFSSCRICARIERSVYDFLCRYQYDVYADERVQAELAALGGLCAYHTWQYEAVASPNGTCAGFAGTVERLAGRLSDLADSRPLFANDVELAMPSGECVVCTVRADAERRSIEELALALSRPVPADRLRFPGLCIEHLGMVVRSLGPGELAADAVRIEAAMLLRLSEDMRRFAIKHEGLRRQLTSAEERTAAWRALSMLAGHADVNGPRRSG